MEKLKIKLYQKFFNSKRKAGFRTIKMKLESEYGIIMNHKKIIRIMKKYGMVTKIRKPNPYKYAAKLRIWKANDNEAEFLPHYMD